MNYTMNLQISPYNAIKSGNKTVEMRLFDERRRAIKQGDIIEFLCEGQDEKLICEVLKTERFENFEEIYKKYDKISLGYSKNDIAHPNDMLIYYDKEKIEKYGTLAITIKKL